MPSGKSISLKKLEHDLENGHNVVCCTDCTLSIKVLYNVLPTDADDGDQQNVNMKNS